MRVIENNKSLTENSRLLGSLIEPYLEKLQSNPLKNRQKILEISHVGKFLMFFDNQIKIDQLSEKPDFILKGQLGKIGLEHQVVIDPKSKKREGFYENIFSIAESELQKDSELPNFLANCYIKPYLNFKLKEKNNLISLIKKVVKQYVLNDLLLDNPLIERIRKMPHSRISVCVNLGAWWQKDLNEEIIERAIEKKNNLISSYKLNSGKTQWLLLVIGSNGDSSYLMDENIELNINSPFDKIYVLEDFSNRLFELK